MATNTNYRRIPTSGEGAAFLIGTDSEQFAERLKQAAGPTETPTPTDSDGGHGYGSDAGGPITRFTETFSALGMEALEHVGLSGHEIADAIQVRVNELYRNEFPLLKPRFERKCTGCGAEFDTRADECPECGGATRKPDPAEKRRVETLLESVNKEGQSLRELAKRLEWDQWLLGCPVLVVRHTYTIADTDTRLTDRGEILHREVDELVRGDPSRIVPVVDEHRRIGGYWWACPKCRQDDDYEPADHDGWCDDCGARLQEVYFAEYADGDDDVDRYYFREEIITFPWAFPRLHGLDGLSPIHHVWLKQAIIDLQDVYAGAFYDPESERLPNQFMILHTTNADKWEERLSQAREDAKDDIYDSPIFANEYGTQASSTPEVQVVDAMPDELLGQNESLKDTFKSDIRQAMNIADVFDSDLEDAGGLNNEGLQIEITDRPTAAQMNDYKTGWLDTLAKRLGIDDWAIDFIPATGPDAEDLRAEVEAGMAAEDAGLDARIEDGQVAVADGEFDPDDEDAATFLQKAGNWMRVNEGREELGLPPVEGPEGEAFGAPGRVGAQQDEGGEPGAGGAGSAGGGGLPDPGANAAADHSSHEFGPDQKAALRRATDVLYDAHRHVIWPDRTSQKAEEPFFADDEDMPEFVKALIDDAIRQGAIMEISDELPATVTRGDVQRFFRDQLQQPQGWSLRSLTKNYAERFGVPEDKAVTAVRTQATNLLNESRALGYQRQGDAGDQLFKWLGPADERTTEACEWLKAQTNPDHGGDPVGLDELEALVEEAQERFFDRFEGADYTPHWNCRHTYVEHFE